MEAATSSPSIVTQLFTAAGVKRVVFVDDRFGITATRIQSMADDLPKEKLDESGAFPDIDFSAEDEEITRSKLAKQISEAESAQLAAMFEKIVAVQYPEHDAARDKSAADYFHTVVSSAAEIIAVSLRQWERHKERLLSEAGTKPTIFIFDDDFTLEGQGKTHGRRLVGETHTTNQNYRFVYALLTHNAPNDDAEVALEKEIAEELPDVADYLLVISKGRLSENSDRFADRMKSFLLYRLFKVLTRRLAEETAAASERAIKQIKDLGIQSFERIILSSSRAEGAWSPDTLVRVIGVYQQQIVKSTIRKDEELHRLVRDINPICDVVTAAMPETVPSNAKRLQHDEIYESGQSINAVHLPIASGDIFTDAGGTQYMILAQPCDLVVRSNGFRRDEQRDRQQFVPVAAVRKVESQYRKTPIPSHEYELPHFVENERWSVRMNETFYLPLWLLDLAVCNRDGQCSISESDTASPLLVEPWIKRHATLVRRAESVALNVAKITDASIDRNELLQSWCRIPLGSPFQVEVEVNGGAWKLGLGLARTLRTAELHATGVLIEYTAFQARLAHPHDLTRFAKIADSATPPT